MAKLSPSILNMDFIGGEDTLRALERAGTELLHMDVMDGIFVPNISFGVPLIESFKKHTSIPMDVHLMIDRPARYIEQFAKVADWLGFHYEAGSPVQETLRRIRELGCRSCLTIKPCTPAEAVFPFLDDCDMVLVMSVEPGFGGQSFMPSALPKLSALRDEINRRGLRVELEIDGGINDETGRLAVEAGATVLVAGSYLLRSDDIEGTARALRNIK